MILVSHLILCAAEQRFPVKTDMQNRASHPVQGAAALAAVLVTFFAMAWEMRLFTRKTNRISDYLQDFLPCLMQIILIAAGEIAAALLLNNPALAFWSPAEGFLWAILCAAILILCGIVTFVTGAARTMLYHDEKR